MKLLVPVAFALTLAACGDAATDTTPEPAVQDDTVVIEERTADEIPDEDNAATLSVTEDGVGVEADVQVSDDINVEVDADSN